MAIKDTFENWANTQEKAIAFLDDLERELGVVIGVLKQVGADGTYTLDRQTERKLEFMGSFEGSDGSKVDRGFMLEAKPEGYFLWDGRSYSPALFSALEEDVIKSVLMYAGERGQQALIEHYARNDGETPDTEAAPELRP